MLKFAASFLEHTKIMLNDTTPGVQVVGMDTFFKHGRQGLEASNRGLEHTQAIRWRISRHIGKFS
jgi:hypothetical protein